ncbi:MAG: PIN domain-containing protein [Bacteroidetes bacterium]|nr:MAG: PIN domain-containing protein [Bacteroidota bacterium]
MSAEVFLDTNLLVYAHTSLDSRKQKIASEIIQQRQAQISTQVVQEFINVLVKKFSISWPVVRELTDQISVNCDIHTNTYRTIRLAEDLAERYGFSFYDSLILAAALESGASEIYSEDMQHKQVIEGQLTIINPFI